MRNTWRITRQRIPKGSTARRNQVRPKIKTLARKHSPNEQLVNKNNRYDSSNVKTQCLTQMSSDTSTVIKSCRRYVPSLTSHCASDSKADNASEPSSDSQQLSQWNQLDHSRNIGLIIIAAQDPQRNVTSFTVCTLFTIEFDRHKAASLDREISLTYSMCLRDYVIVCRKRGG